MQKYNLLSTAAVILFSLCASAWMAPLMGKQNVPCHGPCGNCDPNYDTCKENCNKGVKGVKVKDCLDDCSQKHDDCWDTCCDML